MKSVRLLLLDVDGVLTDGSIIYSDSGAEIKSFSVQDGLGIRLLIQSGVQVGIVTGRASSALRHRCKDLGIEMIYDRVENKGAILPEILTRTGLSAHEIAFAGDDWPDIPLLKKVGVGIAVANAHESVKSIAHWITRQHGGKGAVREICEGILKAKGLWSDIITQWEFPAS